MREWLYDDRVVGRLLRLPLRLLPPRAIVRVLRGPARGLRWRVGASVHGCWLGTYERDKVPLFAGAIRSGDTVFDVGAHVGYYTLCAARLAGPTGRVVAFEPLPRNLQHLREHVTINALSTVRVEPVAVAAARGSARFAAGRQSQMGCLSDAGEIEVSVVDLDGWAATAGVPDPAVIKIDVEGAEADVLRGARELIDRSHPTLLVATHGAEPHGQASALLAEYGYRVEQIGGQADELLCVYGGRRTTGGSKP